jgi:hypothetical protein
MYNLDAIEEQQLLDIYGVLKEVHTMLDVAGELHASALLFDDDEPVLTHTGDALANFSSILNRVMGEKFREGR